MVFEVIKERNRVPRWRLRDSVSGRYIPLKLGRIHLPPTTEANRHVREAVDQVLTGLARENVIEGTGY